MTERYQFVREIGKGGQGTVGLYRDTQTDSLVVIKKCEAMTEQSRKRFFREAKIMKCIQHPHLVEYIDFHENPPQIVMEYLSGGTLKQKIARQKEIPWRESAALMLQIMEGLQALHDHDIIHRDIKPANLLFTESGQVKLADFGVVKSQTFFHEQLTQPEASFQPGTILYTPPEFFSPDPPCNAKTDIYSLGVTFYQTVTGKQPFAHKEDSGNVLNAMLAIVSGNFRSPDLLVTDLPEELTRIIKKMMAVRLEDRYESLALVRLDLQCLLEMGDEDETATDPLSMMVRNFNKNQMRWACEEYTEVPSAEYLKYYWEIKGSLTFMPEWRKKTALGTLLKFALQYGKWDDACEFSQELSSEESFHQHLKAIAKRAKAGGELPKEWFFKAKKAVRNRVWPETEFRCKKTGKMFNEEDVRNHEVFFLPEVCSREVLLEAGTIDFAGYQLCKIPIAHDTLGSYYLALSQDQQPYIVHKIPWEREQITFKASQNIIERYKRGIMLASRLRESPWILSINNPYPIEDGKYTYFFLDYRPSRKLVNFLNNIPKRQRNSFSLSKAYVLVEILRGLELLKSANAIHRYVSPNHINIDFDGNIWIGGFSLAKFEELEDTDWVELTMDLSGVRIGNPYFMAPEQFQGMKYTNHQSDLWAFAAVAYKVITGMPLFNEKRSEILATRRKPTRYTPICEIAENTPEKFATMIEKCLLDNPKERYSDAGALLTDMAKEINDFYNFVKKQ